MPAMDRIIDELGLQPHPEGGYYKETYRSPGQIEDSGLPANYSGKRSYSTCIYFMLTSVDFSAFHRIQQDEIWHFYEGTSIHLHTISPEGVYRDTLIGRDIFSGEQPQVIVPGNHWFAAEVIETDSFALVGCTVAPGFSFADFELGSQKLLVETFPQHQDLIVRLTRE